MCRETHLEYRSKHTFFENVSYGNTEGGAGELLRRPRVESLLICPRI
jgi:hypothetical protein